MKLCQIILSSFLLQILREASQHLSSFFSRFKFLFLSLFSSLLCSSSRFESLLTLSSFTVKDDSLVLLGSLKSMISLAVSLQAFEIHFRYCLSFHFLVSLLQVWFCGYHHTSRLFQDFSVCPY